MHAEVDQHADAGERRDPIARHNRETVGARREEDSERDDHPEPRETDISGIDEKSEDRVMRRVAVERIIPGDVGKDDVLGVFVPKASAKDRVVLERIVEVVVLQLAPLGRGVRLGVDHRTEQADGRERGARLAPADRCVERDCGDADCDGLGHPTLEPRHRGDEINDQKAAGQLDPREPAIVRDHPPDQYRDRGGDQRQTFPARPLEEEGGHQENARGEKHRVAVGGGVRHQRGVGEAGAEVDGNAR